LKERESEFGRGEETHEKKQFTALKARKEIRAWNLRGHIDRGKWGPGAEVKGDQEKRGSDFRMGDVLKVRRHKKIWKGRKEENIIKSRTAV